MNGSPFHAGLISNAAPPGTGRQRVVEIELRRSFDNGIGSKSRSGAIGDRDIPRGRDQHQTGRFRIEREPEIGAVGHADAVGIESFLFHVVS